MKGKKLTAPYDKYRHLLLVRWRFAFPFDMLRYDSAYPWRERDSGQIADPGGEVAIVTRTSEKSHAAEVWTYERWESYGATVAPITEEQAYELRRKEEV